MTILGKCPSCGRSFRTKDEYKGKRAKCPGCLQVLLLEGQHISDHDVFISYSKNDKYTADAICSALESNLIRCWISPRDVDAGRKWGSAIIDAIEDCKVMVLVFSSNAKVSEQVLREVERAVAKGVIVVPFRIEDIPMSKDMEYFLSASHWLDALSEPLEEHIEKLIPLVRALLPNLKQSQNPLSSTSTKVELTNAAWWLEQAASIASEIMEEKATALCSLAKMHARSSNFTAAKAISAKLDNPQMIAKLFQEIAEVQAQAGDIAGAKTTAAGIGDPIQVALAYSLIAKAQLSTGDISGAKATADGLAFVPTIADMVYGDIASAQVTAGDSSSAMNTLMLVKNESLRNAAYTRVILAHANAGNAAMAMAIAEDFSRTASTYAQIGEVLGKAGNISAAKHAFMVAKNLVADSPDPAKSMHFAFIARMQANAEDIVGAVATVKDITDFVQQGSSQHKKDGTIIMTISTTGAEQRDFALRAIAEAHARQGDFTQAKTTSAQITNAHHKVLAYCAIAELEKKAGNITEAQRTLIEASSVATTIVAPVQRIEAYTAIASTQAAVGDTKLTRNNIDTARIIVASIPKANSQIATAQVHAIIKAQISFGDIDGAMETALIFAGMEDTQLLQADGLTATYLAHSHYAIAAAYFKTGKLAALKTWIDSIANPRIRLYAYLGAINELLEKKQRN